MTAGRKFMIEIATIMVGNREVVDPDTVRVDVQGPTDDAGNAMLDTFDAKSLAYIGIDFDVNLPDGPDCKHRRRRAAGTPTISIAIDRRPTEGDATLRADLPLDERPPVSLINSNSSNINLDDIRGMLK